MSWQKTLFQELKARLISQVQDIKSVSLYNGQVEDWRGDDNRDENLELPCVLVEFDQGADWERQSTGVRTCRNYQFRLHTIISDLQEVGKDGPSALNYLDIPLAVVNALDGQSFSSVQNFRFIREELDSARGHIISELRVFTAQVSDESLALANPQLTQLILNVRPEATADPQIITQLQTNNP